MSAAIRFLRWRTAAQFSTLAGWYAGWALSGTLIALILFALDASGGDDYAFMLPLLLITPGLALRSARGTRMDVRACGAPQTEPRPMPVLPISDRHRWLAEVFAAFAWPLAWATTALLLAWSRRGPEILAADQTMLVTLLGVSAFAALGAQARVPGGNQSWARLVATAPWLGFVGAVWAARSGSIPLVVAWAGATIMFAMVPWRSLELDTTPDHGWYRGSLQRPSRAPAVRARQDLWAGVTSAIRDRAGVIQLVMVSSVLGWLHWREGLGLDAAVALGVVMITALGGGRALGLPCNGVDGVGQRARKGPRFAAATETWPVARHRLARLVGLHPLMWSAVVLGALAVVQQVALGLEVVEWVRVCRSAMWLVLLITPLLMAVAVEQRFGPGWMQLGMGLVAGGVMGWTWMRSMGGEGLEPIGPAAIGPAAIVSIVALMLAARHWMPPARQRVRWWARVR